MASPLVVLTDFHAVANSALSYAAGLALPLGARLVLLHARYDALLAPVNDVAYTPVGPQATDQALQKLADEQPVPTQVLVSERELPEAVGAAIRQHNPLLLVLGRPGGASTPVEVMTRTARTLLSTVPYPLLLLPSLDWPPAPPHRMLLAVDGQPFALHQYQDVIGQLLGISGGTLNVVRVADSSHARLGAETILETVVANNLADRLALGRLSEVASPSVVGGVLAEAARQEADLLVVVARHHSLIGSLFHRSVTAQLIEQSSVPLLLLPAQD
ncbi:universal stress protein [Hymenobacter psychrophilus]|uniref:Universal stress protein family protein n=1 Tax=Hymenobacter psychrophilus TaxID=651662 RepID=A0A1H3L7E7_9BACT|nr:universal stress protein [Hymenobacter psychrophilus]SDY60196.1 Universal stress protein family protein [Hymenobacter psychrophilus]